VLAGSLGLTIGTRVEPRQVSLMFSILVMPMSMLGAVYYPWKSLEAVRWLQILVLVNPLVYMSEGFRAALTEVPTMSLWAIYGVLTGFAVLFTYVGVKNFTKRVIA